MGCDIHLYKEKMINGQWVAADQWAPDDDYDGKLSVDWHNRFTDRNYQLFGLLSKGVRSEHPFSFEPRGLPVTMSQEVRDEIAHWGSDGHSHSYLYLHELKDMLAFSQKETIEISGMMKSDQLASLRESIAHNEPNWDLIWPYCQMTSAEGYEDFELDIPASLYFEEALKKIIAGFDGMGGENHRIVFFFDN